MGELVEMVLPPEHLMRVAWEAYKKTKDFANTKGWASAIHQDQHLDGCLWNVFCAGYLAAEGASRVNKKDQE